MDKNLKRNNYDRVSGFYDGLSRLVFGHSIIDAQCQLLQCSFPGDRMLIAGGGTGFLLAELGGMSIAPLKITFVELSGKMLQLAKKRDTGYHKVDFVHCAIEDFFPEHAYDIIITPFLFDNFSQAKAGMIIDHLDRMLALGGFWLMADFTITKENPLWQKILLRLMYIFFKLSANIEARNLPDTHHLLRNAGYDCLQEYFFYKKFIRAAVYVKRDRMRLRANPESI